jgi:hypothetical protein
MWLRWDPWRSLRRGPADEDQDVILAAALDHSWTQLLSQIVDETSLDGRLTGVLGFNGALIAADIAAQTVLGRWWWTPLPFVAFASFRCFGAIFEKDTYLGPEALQFYATYGGQSARAGREQLLADLDVAFKANTQRAAEKTRVLKDALRILFVGLFVAGALIVFATPSKVDSHVCSHPASAAPCSAATGAGPSTIRSAAGRPAWGYRIAPAAVHR